MTEEEASEVYRELLEALRAAGVTWLANQVVDEIRSGKPVKKSLARPREFSGSFVPGYQDEPQPRRRRKETYIVSEPYSQTETLGLLIASIETIIVDGPGLEIEISKSLNELPPNVPILFSSEREDTHPIKFTRNDSERQRAALDLQNSLDELKRYLRSGDR